MKVPHGTSFADLMPVVPFFLTFVMSFVYLGIYWNNHHHLLHLTDRVTGGVLWANLHLLFWLSLIPFVTGWMAENHFAREPVMLYGIVLLMAGVAYGILVKVLTLGCTPNSRLRQAVGRDVKGKLSVVFYAIALGAAFWNSSIAVAIYVLVALIWVIPDRRIEGRTFASE